LSVDEQKIKHRVWEEEIESIEKDIKKRVSSKFFNPFRGGGPYYGGIQALFLLGANKYHTYFSLYDMMKEVMSKMNSKKLNENKELIDSWTWFYNKKARNRSMNARDIQGRIHENMRTLQRLGGVYPYGMKLKQLCSCIDIKRVHSEDIEEGEWLYRLNTKFSKTEDVKPYYCNKLNKSNPVEKKDIFPRIVNRDTDEVTTIEEVISEAV